MSLPPSTRSQVPLPLEVPTGVVLPFANENAPTDWLLCDGLRHSRAIYADLFAEIGIAFGAGDGSTTFNVPDLRGRVPLGKDDLGGNRAYRVGSSAARQIGGGGGASTHRLSQGQMPRHSHNDGASGPFVVEWNTGSAGFNIGAGNTTTWKIWDWNTGTAGSGYSHNNLQPYLTLAYIIKA